MEDSKLTAREQNRVITQKSLDYVPNCRGLGYHFYSSMLLNNDRVAQIDGETGNIDTYGDLLRRCIRVCMHLFLKDITKNDILCVCTSNHFNSCVPIICSYFLGIRAAPLDPSVSLDEIIYLLNELKPRIIFVGEEVVDLIEKAFTILNIACEIVVFGPTEDYTPFDQFLERLEFENEFVPLPITDLNESAIILFDNEKTKISKGICLSYYTLMVQTMNTILSCNLGNIIYSNKSWKLRTKNGFMVTMGTTTFSSISAIQLLNSTTLTGTARVILRSFEAKTVWQLIDRYQISFLTCTTQQAKQIYQIEKPEEAHGKSLKMILTLGTRLTLKDLQELRKTFPKCFITNCFETFEAGGPITRFSFNDPEHIRDQYQKPSSCGRLVPGMTCKIVNPNTNEILGVNEPGELYYTSEYIMNGYYIYNSRSDFNRGDWIKSGHISFYDEKHSFYILDSYEDVFRYKCKEITPFAIESVITQHPAVEDAVVIGVAQKEDIGKLPVALLKLNKKMKDKVTAQDIKLFSNRLLSKRNLFVGQVEIVKDIPLTSLGAPIRRKLKIGLSSEIS